MFISFCNNFLFLRIGSVVSLISWSFFFFKKNVRISFQIVEAYSLFRDTSRSQFNRNVVISFFQPVGRTYLFQSKCLNSAYG